MRRTIIVVTAVSVLATGTVVGTGGVFGATPRSAKGGQTSQAHAGHSHATAATGAVATVAAAVPVGAKWSNPATWGGRVPSAGAVAVIPRGKQIVLDVDPPALAGIDVAGTLLVADRPLKLTAGYIVVSGTLRMGVSAAVPFRSKAVITLTGAPGGDVMGMGTRGILVHGGRLQLFGAAPAVPWTVLSAHATAGATRLSVARAPRWRPGDQLVVGPTDFYGVAQTQRLTVQSNVGNVVATTSRLSASRWGRLQYVTRTGMSLARDPGFVPPKPGTPTVLDERAPVGNLSRNIVIQSVDDAAWRNRGFGAHVMVMGPSSSAQISGVELRRVGQAGVKGRYPIHWHLLSYTPSGAVRADARGQYIRGSTVWDSRNRCIVLHATNGVRVEDNICYDVKGHAFFLEDAVERRNVFAGNLALKMRNPADAQRLLVHEGSVFQGGSSGFWLTNPDNVVRRNRAGDAEGNGFWMSFPRKPLGLSKNVRILPDRTRHGVFDDNVAHSAQSPGIHLNWAPVDDAGNLAPNKYIPTRTGAEDRFGDNRVRFALNRNVSFKNGDGAYRNNVSWPDYNQWVVADNAGAYFAGAGDDGYIRRALVVGTSLNKANGWPRFPDKHWEPPVAFASYHSTFNMQDNVVVNFPFVPGRSSGAFKTEDYYLIGMEKGTVRNSGNRLISSHPGYRFPPPLMRADAKPNDNWTLSGALWDPHGYWGRKGNFWVYDVPFLTEGAQCTPVAPAGRNGASCGGQYYGVEDFIVDEPDRRAQFLRPISVRRQRPDGSLVGTWAVRDGATSTMLGNMRHFTARPGAEYVLTFPGTPTPTRRVEMGITNAYRATDSFVMAVSWAGGSNPVVFTGEGGWNRSGQHGPQPGASNRRDMRQASSLAQVRAGTGNLFWVDTARQLLWFKYVGGLRLKGSGAPNSDWDLYRPHAVVIEAR